MSLGFLDRLRQRNAPKPPLEVEGPSQLRAYWEGLRIASSLPARAALDPRAFGGILDRVFLAERIGRGLAEVRVAGSALADLCGTDLRGLPLSCLFTAESRPLLALALEEVFAEPAVAEFDLGSDRSRSGLPFARLMLLPLDDDGDRRQLLGVIGFNAPATACKLQILARRKERLVLPATLADVAPVVGAPTAALPRQPHLHLVQFNTD